PWTSAPGHGWGPDPWLPFPPEAAERSVEAQRADEGSVLHLYRRLLAARRGSPALQLGDLALVDTPAGTLAWRRTHGDDERLVGLTMSDAPVDVPLTGTVEVASDGAGEGGPFAGTLPPDTAVVLRPTPP